MRAILPTALLALASAFGCGESVECVVDTDCPLGNRCEAQMCVELNTPPVRDAATGSDTGGEDSGPGDDTGPSGDTGGAADSGNDAVGALDTGAAMDTGAMDADTGA